MKKNRIVKFALAVLLCTVSLLSCIPETAYAGMNRLGGNVIYFEDDKDSEEGLIDTLDFKYGKYYKPYLGPNNKKFATDMTVAHDPSEGKDLSKMSFVEKIKYGLFIYLYSPKDAEGRPIDTGTAAQKEIRDKAYNAAVDEQGAVGDILGMLMYGLASFFHVIMDGAGITIDNVILGRVGGHGTLVAEDTIVSLYQFELEKGNPYGVVAALIYSIIRKYMYIFMILVSFVMFVKTFLKSDNPRVKLEFRSTMTSLLTAAAGMFFMPYLLEVFLYGRDIILSGIVKDGLLGLFSDESYGLMNAFKYECDAYMESTGTVLWTSALLYLAAVAMGVVFATMYVAVALGMLIAVVAFPVVCVKSLVDSKAIGNWIWEVVGLSATPIIDSILMLVPLIFVKMANGSSALNFVSLLACGCVLPARQQLRKHLGISSNNAMEAGGLMTAIGMTRLLGSIGRAGGRAIGQIAGGIKQGAGDDAMANFYDAQSQMDTATGENAEKQLANGYFNSNGGIAMNPAALSGMGQDIGDAGNLSQRAMNFGGSQVAYKQRMFDEANANANSNLGHFTDDALNREDVLANDAVTVAGREKDLKEEQIRSILGRSMPVSSENNLYDAFATVDNFESQAFASKLSNAKKAELYRQRATQARKQGITSGVLTAGGAALGGVLGFGATAYMDSGTRAMVTSAGIDVGATSGNVYKNMAETRRLKESANAETTLEGDLSDIHYTIRTGKNVPDNEKLKTSDRYKTVKPYFEQETIGKEGITDKQAACQAPLEAEGSYTRVNDGSLDYDKSRNFDASTGEWYEKMTDGVVYADMRSWMDNITEEVLSSANDFNAFIQNPQNAELNSHYYSATGNATLAHYNGDRSLNSKNGDRYYSATVATKAVDSSSNDAAGIASHNAEMLRMKETSSREISDALLRSVNNEMSSFIQNSGLNETMREQLKNRISEHAEEYIKNSVTPQYMKLKGWDYDSLMRKE